MGTTQPTGTIEDALRVSDRVQIRNVSIVTAKMARSDVREGARFSVDIERGTRAVMEATSGLLRVQVELKFMAREPGEPRNPAAVEVGATYEVTYQVADLSGLTQRHFEAFAEINGVFNVWPYFREFLQSALGRMGMPPFTLPVLRIGSPDDRPRGHASALRKDSHETED